MYVLARLNFCSSFVTPQLGFDISHTLTAKNQNQCRQFKGISQYIRTYEIYIYISLFIILLQLYTNLLRILMFAIFVENIKGKYYVKY